MIVYFDESYDNERHYLLFGSLFVPPLSKLHQRFLDIRRKKNHQPEVKYTRCGNDRAWQVHQLVIAAFLDDSAHFRCVVVDQHGFDDSEFRQPHESEAIALDCSAAVRYAHHVVDSESP